MSFLISIGLNYLGRFNWYLQLIKWLLNNLFELVGTSILYIITAIIVAVGATLFISAIVVILGITLIPKYLSNHYDCGYFNWLFIVSIPLGLLLFSALIEFTVNRNNG